MQWMAVVMYCCICGIARAASVASMQNAFAMSSDVAFFSGDSVSLQLTDARYLRHSCCLVST